MSDIFRLPHVCPVRKNVCQLLYEKHKVPKIQQGFLGLYYGCHNQDKDLVDFLLENESKFGLDIYKEKLTLEQIRAMINYSIEFENTKLTGILYHKMGTRLHLTNEMIKRVCDKNSVELLETCLNQGKDSGMKTREIFDFIKDDENGKIKVVFTEDPDSTILLKMAKVILEYFDYKVSEEKIENPVEPKDSSDEESDDTDDTGESDEESEDPNYKFIMNFGRWNAIFRI